MEQRPELRQTIALNAIRGITETSRAPHMEIIETLRALKFSTAEAAELRDAVAREWRGAGEGWARELLRLAKSEISQYVRNYGLR